MPRSAALTGGAPEEWRRSGEEVGQAGEEAKSLFPWPKEAEWSLPGDERILGAAKATLSINGFV